MSDICGTNFLRHSNKTAKEVKTIFYENESQKLSNSQMTEMNERKDL